MSASHDDLVEGMKRGLVAQLWSFRCNNRLGASRTEPRLQLGLFVDFKAGLRNLGLEVHEKSAVKLRDF